MLLLNLELNATAKHPQQQQQQPDSLDPRQTRMRCSLSPPLSLSLALRINKPFVKATDSHAL